MENVHVTSTLAAEMLVLLETTEHCFLMRKVIGELFGVACELIGVTDNRSLRVTPQQH